MVAWVFGATGLTGREVVRQMDRPRIAHVRPDSSRLEEWRRRFEAMGAEVDATPWEREALAASFRERPPQVLFALLGTTRRRGRRAKAKGGADETYETVDYGLTRMLLDAALDAEAAPRFVYLSSMGVGPKARGGYLQVRHRFETELRGSGLPWVIARASFIVGDRDEERPGEAVGARLGDAALGLVGALGGKRMQQKYRSQTGAELARSLVHLALAPDAADQVFESDRLRALA